MPGISEFTAPGSFRRWIEECRCKAEEIRPISVAASGVAFGLAASNMRPKRIEVSVNPNGRSIEITPWNKDERTNCMLQMDKKTAVQVGQAILDLAKELPDEPKDR